MITQSRPPRSYQWGHSREGVNTTTYFMKIPLCCIVPVLLFCIGLAPGCFSPKPVVTKWYEKEQKLDTATLASRLNVRGQSEPINVNETPKDVFTLSPEGQKAYIKALGALTKKPDELAPALATSIEQEKVVTQHDLTTFKKRIVLSAFHDKRTEADRLTQLRITMHLDTAASGFEFLTWDKITTVYGSVELGDLSAESTDSFKFTPSIEASGDLIGTQGGEISRSRTLKEDTKLTQRFVELTGTLSADTATLFMQGVPGRNITGNILVDLTVRSKRNVSFTLSEFKKLMADDKPNPFEAVIMVDHQFTLPDTLADVNLTLSYAGKERHVLEHEETQMEGDDVIEIDTCSGTAGLRFPFIRDTELRVKSWYVYASTERYIEIEEPETGMYGALAFFSEGQTRAFISWLQALMKTDPKSKSDPIKGHRIMGRKLRFCDGTELDGTIVNALGARQAFIDPAQQ